MEKSTKVSIGTSFGSVLGALIWMAGVVMAKGFWMTTFAIFFPPYGFYKVTEKILLMLKWI